MIHLDCQHTRVYALAFVAIGLTIDCHTSETKSQPWQRTLEVPEGGVKPSLPEV